MKNAMKPASYITYIISFGLARGALFFAPILLANILPLATYGLIETAQAIAGIAALLIGFGLSGTVPLILVREDQNARWDTLLLLICLLAAGLLVLFSSMLGLGRPAYSVPVLVPLATAVLLMQGFWATTLQSLARSTMAVFLEAGFWLVVVIGGVCYARFSTDANWIVVFLAAYALLLLAHTAGRYLKHRAAFQLSDLKNNLKLGAPLLLASVLTAVLISFGRVALGQAATAETMGVYAVMFRATALPLVVHQILVIGLFRQIFSWDLPELRRRSPLIIWGVGASVLAFWLLVDPLGWLLGQRFASVFAQFEFEGRIILLQTVLWSAISLNDLLCSRGKIAAQVARWTGPYMLIALPAVFFALGYISGTTSVLGFFVPVYGAIMAGFYGIQCWAMARNGSVFLGLWGSTAAIVLIGVAGLFLHGT